MRPEQRSARFQRNERLEALLSELNTLLAPAEALACATPHAPRHPLVLVLGCPRSGTTLLMQWLAATGQFAYPTNFLSRFYGAPSVGARIQRMLLDPELQYGDELAGPADRMGFDSELGKTRGPWSPNEFWYFWRRFVPNEYPEHLDEAELAKVDTRGLMAELAALDAAFDRPLAMKGLILQQNAAFLAERLPHAVFLFVRRDPFFTMQSLLEARERFFGDRRRWYSVKPREHPELVSADPFEQVAGQSWHVEQGVASELARVDPDRWIEVRYESFCADPGALHRRLVSLFAERGHGLDPVYRGPERFSEKNRVRLERRECDRLVEAYARWSGVRVGP